MAEHTTGEASGSPPGHRFKLYYPAGRTVEIIAAGVTGSLVAMHKPVERSTVNIMQREADGARRVGGFEFTGFEDLAGACEARAALASYVDGDRALALSHANLAAVLHTGWRPLVSLLAGREA